MNLHERLVAAILGGLWGALAGFLLAAFMSLTAGRVFDAGLLIANWKSTIAGCATVFAALGLVFGVSIGTLVGSTIHWFFNLVRQDDSGGLLTNESIWIRLFVLAGIILAIYLYVS
nr:hypothetical protein [uncultured Rhodoferax sp.]